MDRQARARVRKLIDEGVTDEDQLVAALGDWQAAVADGEPLPIVFLGLAVTMDCSFEPRCVYCDQPWLPGRLDLAYWKALLTEAATFFVSYMRRTRGCGVASLVKMPADWMLSFSPSVSFSLPLAIDCSIIS